MTGDPVLGGWKPPLLRCTLFEARKQRLWVNRSTSSLGCGIETIYVLLHRPAEPVAHLADDPRVIQRKV
jgi:hypothetical protein